MSQRRRSALVLLPAAALGSALLAVESSAHNVLDRANTDRSTARIAFLRQADGDSRIFVMNRDGSGQRPLVSGAKGPLAWSPDGRRLAFARSVNSRATDIFLINANGTGLRRLTATALYEHDPAWSPDGRSIAYASRGFSHGQNRGGLYLMDANGTNQRRLDRLPPTNHVGSLDWSPDGRRIAFTGGGAVFVINSDGGGQRRLTRGSGYFFLAWSPDGRRIAFVKMPGRYNSIYTVGSGSERLLTTHAYTESGFAWRPDSTGIIYARELRGGVYSINLDGNADRRLTRNPLRRDLLAGGFSWSPDGRTIAYASDITGDGDIYLMNPDGSKQQQLTNSPAIDGAPTWSPRP